MTHTLSQHIERLKQQTPHALLITSREFSRSGLNEADARQLASELCGFAFSETSADDLMELHHPDFFCVDTERSVLRLEELSAVGERVQYPPQLGRRRLIVIDRAQRLNAHAGNSLLKNLEEPMGACLFVLTAPSLRDVMPTLSSRCVKIHLQEPGSVAPAEQHQPSPSLQLFEESESAFLQAVVKRLESQPDEFVFKAADGVLPSGASSVPLSHDELLRCSKGIAMAESLSKKYSWDQLNEALVELVGETRTQAVRLNPEGHASPSLGLQWLTEKLRDWKRWSEFNPSSVMRLTEIFTMAAR